MPTIILPKTAITELNNEYVKVQLPDESKSKKSRDWSGLNNARGILKEYKIDPIEYQNRIRSDWDEVERLSSSLKNIYGDGMEYQKKIREESDNGI